jgi:hypothetical protein
VRISVSEWSTLRLAVKLPRVLVNPERAGAALGKHLYTRGGMVLVGAAIVSLLVVLHLKTANPEVKRLTALTAQLAGVKLIDAGWEATIARARSDASPAKPPVEATELQRIQRALDAAAAEARTNAVRTSIDELRKAYIEKADLVTRVQRASADARQALAAAMRSDGAVTTLLRSLWSDFPQRERLVAAENLVVRVIAEAQQYHYHPTAAHRASLESYTLELTRAQSLPKPLQAALGRLEVDAHQILLLKPLEQMLVERLAALKTVPKIDELNAFYRGALEDALASRDRWRIALVVYTIAVALLLVWFGARAIARYRDLEVLYAGRTRELAKALQQLRGVDAPTARVTELRRPAATTPDEVSIISERR